MPRTPLARTPVTAEPTANPRWALERSVKAARIPAPAKLLMLTLMTCLGPGSLDLGSWSPGMRRLTAETGLNNHTVVRYVGLLGEHGWLSARKRKGRRTEYVLSAGRAFTDSAKSSNLPAVVCSSNTSVETAGLRGVATTDNGGVATTDNTTVATTDNTFRTFPDRESEQVKTAGQDLLLDEQRQAPGNGRSPAHSQEEHREVLSLVATPLAVHPDDDLLDGIELC